MSSNWKTVKNQGGKSGARNRQLVERDLTTERFPQGFRTFDTLEQVFSVVLLKKLRNTYREVRFQSKTSTGEQSKTGHTFMYVVITMTGPACDVDDAFADAETFLNTGRQDPERYLEAQWRVPAEVDTPIPRMADRARIAADQLGISINWSHGKSCFFIIRVLLKHEHKQLREGGVTRERLIKDMVMEAKTFLLAASGNTFRHPDASHADPNGGRGGFTSRGGRGGGRGGRGGAPRQYHDSSAIPGFQQSLAQIDGLPPLEAKQGLRILFDEMQKHRPSDILTWLSLCYEVDKAFIKASHAALETVDMDLSIDNQYTNIGKLELRPDAGYMPFTQRFPKIRPDDVLHVRFPGGDILDLTVYSVNEYVLLVHLGEDERDSEVVTRAIRLGEKVSMTVNPGPLIGMLTALQKCLTYHDVFDRIKGVGRFRHDKYDNEQLMRAMKSEGFRSRGSDDHDDLAGPQGGGGGAAAAAGPQGEAKRGGRGRGAAGTRLERGGRQRVGPSSSSETSLRVAIVEGLYDEQQLAAHCVLNARGPRIYIDGPGGTGKTETLVRTLALIRHVKPSSKILVVTPTVIAGDVIATRLLALYKTLGMDSELPKWKRLYGTRFHPLYCNPNLYPYSNCPCDDDGHPLKFNELGHENRFQHEGDFFDAVQDDVDLLICGTTTARKLSPVWLGRVTYVFMDEAGCTALADSLGVLKEIPETATLVMAGDPQQLLPRSYCPFTKQSLQTNPLQFFDNALKVPLRTSHRSSAALVHIQSQLFYGGQLQAAGNNAQYQPGDQENTCFPRWSGHHDNPYSVRILHNNGPESRTGASARAAQSTAHTKDLVNKSEVEIVCSAVLSLCVECNLAAEDIGVICEYPEQGRRIKQRLSMSGKRSVRVSSIDDFQGHEREVMIAAMTRSVYDPKDSDAIDLHKLCTVLTRARSLALIVSNVPVYLERDAHKNKKRASKGKWTELVETCREKMAIDGLDENGDFVGVNAFKVATKVDIKETASKRGEEDGKRRMVSAAEVRANQEEFFIGVVVSREGGTLRVRNRWKSTLDIAIDEHVASGLRSYAVFPGDVVAVAIDPEVPRWLEANERGQQMPIITMPRDTTGKLVFPPASSPCDFVRCFDVSVFNSSAAFGQSRPVGAIVTVLKRTKVLPTDVAGTVEGNYFVPDQDQRFPMLELQAEPGFRPESQRPYKASVQLVESNSGELVPRYLVQAPPAPVHVPLTGMLPNEYASFLSQAPDILGFVAMRPDTKLSRQPLVSVSTPERVSQNYSRVQFTIIAPAIGLLACQVGNPSADELARQGWSDWIQKQRRTEHIAFPDPSNDSDGFKIPRPEGDHTAMIGVSFVLEYFDQPYPAQLPDNYPGPTLVGQPQVAALRRGHFKLPGPDEDFTRLASTVLRNNGAGVLTVETDAWITDLLHIAGNAAARILLRELPANALLLRQSIASAPVEEEHAGEVYDAPEWFVPSTVTDDGLQWELAATHASPQLAPYTSFAFPHHSYGDMLVQHLLLFASGVRTQDRAALIGSLRDEAARLNTLMILNCP